MTKIQKLQIETRQQLHSRYHQLQHIENAYISIMDESKRDQVLHITKFDHDKIEQLYEIFSSVNLGSSTNCISYKTTS